MTISMKLNNSIRVVETLSAPGPLSAVPQNIIENTGWPYTLNSGLAWNGLVTLAAGVATLDMTALPRTGLSALDATTYKLWAMYVVATAANTQLITIVPGAANPYGAADIGAGLSLKPGSNVLIGPLAAAGVVNSIAVGPTNKNLDFASAMAAATATVVLLFAAP